MHFRCGWFRPPGGSLEDLRYPTSVLADSRDICQIIDPIILKAMQRALVFNPAFLRFGQALLEKATSAFKRILGVVRSGLSPDLARVGAAFKCKYKF
jgi:hypothetical protein